MGSDPALKGGKWKVCDEQSIDDIYYDKWIPREITFKLFSPPQPLSLLNVNGSTTNGE